MIDWDRPDWGGHVHMDSHGSWLDAEGGQDNDD